MRKSMILVAATALSACGQSPDGGEAQKSTANETAAVAKPAPYCFFKDAETKGWKAKVDKSGNVTVSGQAYREDARYKAMLAPATVSGSDAEVAPTIGPNDTGFAAPGDWWPVSETIPDSHAVTKVTVKCGDETIATLSVQRQK
jgi:hypothetical protein